MRKNERDQAPPQTQEGSWKSQGEGGKGRDGKEEVERIEELPRAASGRRGEIRELRMLKTGNKNRYVVGASIAALLVFFLASSASAFGGMGGPMGGGKTSDSKRDKTTGSFWKDDEVMLKIAKKDVTYGEVKEIYAKQATGNGELVNLTKAEQRTYMTRFLYNDLYLREALEQNLQNSEEFLYNNRFKIYTILTEVYRQREVVDKVKVTDEQAMQYIPPALDEVKLRVIVKKDMNAAKDVYERALKGADFTEMATKESEGFLASKGGETEWLNLNAHAKFPSTRVSQFLEAPVGKVFEPFYGDIGFIVARVEAKRTGEELRKMELDQRREEIAGKFYEHEYTEKLKALNTAAKIVMHEDVAEAASGKKNALSEKGEEVLDMVVLEVGEEKFTAKDVLGDMSVTGHSGQPIIQRVEAFVPRVLVAQQAKKLGLDKDPIFAEKWNNSRDKLLVEYFKNLVLRKIENEKIEEAEYLKYYEEHKDEYKTGGGYEIAVIMLTTQADADAALKRVNAGEDFHALAKTLSKHDITAKEGGRMGVLGKKEMPKLVYDAIEKLEAGKVVAKPIELVAQDGKPIWLLVKYLGARNPAQLGPESAKTRKATEALMTAKRANYLKQLSVTLFSKHGYEICFKPE